MTSQGPCDPGVTSQGPCDPGVTSQGPCDPGVTSQGLRDPGVTSSIMNSSKCGVAPACMHAWRGRVDYKPQATGGRGVRTTGPLRATACSLRAGPSCAAPSSPRKTYTLCCLPLLWPRAACCCCGRVLPAAAVAWAACCCSGRVLPAAAVAVCCLLLRASQSDPGVPRPP